MAKAKEKPGISKLIVGGFKSIAKRTEIEIRPLTVFCGANSSGKSSAMQPLLLMKQTLESPYDPGPLRLDGPNLRFTSAKQFNSICPGRKSPSRFQFGLQLSDGDSFESDFKVSVNEKIELVSTEYHEHPHPRYRVRTRGTAKELESIYANEARKYPGFPNYKTLICKAATSHFFAEVDAISEYADGGSTGTAIGNRRAFERDISRALHVSGHRTISSRNFGATASNSHFPGVFEAYVASLLHSWGESKSFKISLLEEDLYSLGLTWKIVARKINEAHLEISVGRLPKSLRAKQNDLVNISDVGLGVSYVLPVLVGLHAVDQAMIIYIEEPEIHLHPRAQFALAKCIVNAANRGARVVIETHSSQLLLGLQTAIAQNEIDPKHVIFHWFERDPLTGESKITAVEPDSAGRFGDWPVDFDEAVMEAQTKYLDVAEAKVVDS